MPANGAEVLGIPSWRSPMKNLVLAAIAVIGLSVGAANGHSPFRSMMYHAPAHNFYQNNWMGA